MPTSEKRDFESLIKNSTQAAISDLNNIDSDLVRILIPYFDIHTDARLLLASCKHRKIGNWMERLEIAFEKSPQSFSDENAVISQIQIMRILTGNFMMEEMVKVLLIQRLVIENY